MEKFRTRNGVEMVRSTPLNWLVSKRYAAPMKGEENIEDLVIHIGSLDEMYQVLLKLDEMVLSFTECGFDSDSGVFRFRVKSIDEASTLVWRFAEGMKKTDSLINTIYV